MCAKSKFAIALALAIHVHVVLLPSACTREKQGNSINPATDIAATYNLVYVAGNPVPKGSGSITLNNDGTLTSVMDWGGGDIHNFKGTYVKEGDKYLLTWAGAGQTSASIDGPELTMINEGTLFIYWKKGVTLTSTDPAEAQQVLDRFLGNWTWEATTYGAGPRPEEKHISGRSSFARVLGGDFIEETGEDSETGFSLVMYTYDQARRCYRLWVFLSKNGGPDTPFKGAWNEASRTISWAVTNAEGQFVTIQHHFVSYDAFDSNIVAKDSEGQTLWGQSFKFTRDGKQQIVTRSAVAGGASSVGQDAGQKVLDRLLGTWKWEAPGHAHATGTYQFNRILGGTFVRGWTREDAEGNEVLLLYTYDQRQKCYRYWTFLSGLGANESPVSGTWNETARTLDWTGLDNNQLPLSAQYRFPSDDTFECTILLKNHADQDVYRAAYKLTRMPGSQIR